MSLNLGLFMMTLISWVNGIYGLVSCIQRFQLLL